MTDSKHWFSVKEKPPYEGSCVAVLHKHGEEDPDFWTTDIAYFCDGGFYEMKYDDRLGVMRKCFVSDRPEYWSHYYVYSPSEIKGF